MKNLDFFGFFSVKFFLNSARDFMDFCIVGRDFMDFWIVGNHIMKCMVHHQIIDIECTAYLATVKWNAGMTKLDNQP